MKKGFIKGFTLVELMVVVAIIAVLTAIVTANITSARAKSRDAKRISDVGNLQLALTIFFERCDTYPTTLNLAASCTTSGGTTIKFSDFISVIPTPPSPAGADSPTYRYGVDSTITPPTDYILATQLENTSSVLNDDIDGPIPGGAPGLVYSVRCEDSSGIYINNYCVGPK